MPCSGQHYHVRGHTCPESSSRGGTGSVTGNSSGGTSSVRTGGGGGNQVYCIVPPCNPTQSTTPNVPRPNSGVGSPAFGPPTGGMGTPFGGNACTVTSIINGVPITVCASSPPRPDPNEGAPGSGGSMTTVPVSNDPISNPPINTGGDENGGSGAAGTGGGGSGQGGAPSTSGQSGTENQAGPAAKTGGVVTGHDGEGNVVGRSGDVIVSVPGSSPEYAVLRPGESVGNNIWGTLVQGAINRRLIRRTRHPGLGSNPIYPGLLGPSYEQGQFVPPPAGATHWPYTPILGMNYGPLVSHPGTGHIHTRGGWRSTPPPAGPSLISRPRSHATPQNFPWMFSRRGGSIGATYLGYTVGGTTYAPGSEPEGNAFGSSLWSVGPRVLVTP